MSTSTIPPKVAVLIDSWKTFIGIAEEFRARVTAMREESKRALGMTDSIASYHDFSSECLPDLRAAAKSLVNAIAYEARQELSPAGSRLEIDTSELESRFFYDEDRGEFDPANVWEYLASTYSPTVGFRQQAVVLRRNVTELYRRNAGQEVKRVGGRPVLTMTAYAESYSSQFYSYNSQESISKVLGGLATVLNASGLVGDGEVRAAVAEARAALTSSGRGQPPRLTFTDEILIVPFKSKIEFRISERLFTELSLFIAEHGPSEDSHGW